MLTFEGDRVLISRRTNSWIPRPPMSARMVQLLAIPVAVAALAGLTMGTGGASASADSTPTTSVQEAGMAPGRHFQDPPDANTATGPNLKITLPAADTPFDLYGKRVWGQAYNGDFVAPTLHLTPGQTATIVLVNQLSVATNLH